MQIYCLVGYNGLIDGSLTPNVIRNNGRCGKLSRRSLRMSFGTMDDAANFRDGHSESHSEQWMMLQISSAI